MPETKPVLAEPDQRYWRRRANFRVRKARWTRTMLRWALVLAIDGFMCVALIQAGSRMVDRFREVAEFAVDHIEVGNARRADAVAIEKDLAVFRGRNLVDVNLNEVKALTKRNPWVLDATAKRLLPDTIRVTLIERRPAAIAVIEGLAHVIDSNGHVVGASGPGLGDDLPVISGFDGMQGEELENALRRGVAMVERLREVAGPWVREISELDLSRPDRVAVRTIDPGPMMLLDPADVGRNVNEFLDLRREIARRVGPLEYVDLRWRDRIAAQPLTTSIAMEEG